MSGCSLPLASYFLPFRRRQRAYSAGWRSKTQPISTPDSCRSFALCAMPSAHSRLTTHNLRLPNANDCATTRSVAFQSGWFFPLSFGQALYKYCNHGVSVRTCTRFAQYLVRTWSLFGTHTFAQDWGPGGQKSTWDRPGKTVQVFLCIISLIFQSANDYATYFVSFVCLWLSQAGYNLKIYSSASDIALSMPGLSCM